MVKPAQISSLYQDRGAVIGPMPTARLGFKDAREWGSMLTVDSPHSLTRIKLRALQYHCVGNYMLRPSRRTKRNIRIESSSSLNGNATEILPVSQISEGNRVLDAFHPTN